MRTVYTPNIAGYNSAKLALLRASAHLGWEHDTKPIHEAIKKAGLKRAPETPDECRRVIEAMGYEVAEL